MKALVTGATGLIGNNLVRMLLDDGLEVRAMSTSSSSSAALQNLDVEPIEADIRDPGEVMRATQGVNVVFHCAGLVGLGWSGYEDYESINVGGTKNIVKALRGRDVRLVQVSSVHALGVAWRDRLGDEDDFNPMITPCPYVLTKRASDSYIASQVVNEDLDAVTVYPGMVLGPWDWKPSSGQLMLAIAKHYSPWVPTGGASLTDARDVARGTIAAFHRGLTGRRYILAGHNLRYPELWRLIASSTGSRRPIFPAGPLVRVLGAWGSETISRITGREPLLNSVVLKITAMRQWFSSQRSIDELGYHVRPAEQIVRDAWEWMSENHKI